MSSTSSTASRVQQLETIQNEAKELFARKNRDYGDAFAEYGTIGVLVRIGDKLKRGINISKTGINVVNDESMRDSLIDLHNYAAMAIMLMDEKADHNNDDSVPMYRCLTPFEPLLEQKEKNE